MCACAMCTFMKPLHNHIHSDMRAQIMTGIIHGLYYLPQAIIFDLELDFLFKIV